MKCRRAKALIHLQREGMLNDAQRRQLEEHLDSCEDCGAYARSEKDFAASLDDDVLLVEHLTNAGDTMDQGLHAALLRERESDHRYRSPLAGLQRLLSRWRTAFPAAVIRGAQAAVLIVLALIISAMLLTPPIHSPQACRFGHLAAFDTQRSPDGRVYASLTQHSSVSRLNGSGSVAE